MVHLSEYRIHEDEAWGMSLWIILFTLIDTVSGNTSWERDPGLCKVENVSWATVACIHSALCPEHGLDRISCLNTFFFDCLTTVDCILNLQAKVSPFSLKLNLLRVFYHSNKKKILRHPNLSIPRFDLCMVFPCCGLFYCAVLIHPSYFCISCLLDSIQSIFNNFHLSPNLISLGRNFE